MAHMFANLNWDAKLALQSKRYFHRLTNAKQQKSIPITIYLRS